MGRYEHFSSFAAGKGWQVRAFDPRGHGQSEGRRGHVYSFDEYIEDLELFLRLVRVEHPKVPTFLCGHSQGGLIVLRYALKKGLRGLKGLVAVAPMLGMAMDVPPLKALLGRVMSGIWPTLSLPTGIVIEELTHDPQQVKHTLEDPLYGKKATARWFTEAMSAAEETFSAAEKFEGPLMLLAAGDDRLVSTRRIRDFFKQLSAEDKTLHEYEGAFHELLREEADVRDRVLADLADWIAERTGS